jgi:cytochrome oxidase Cu insertion factor (SCO1/SenC/PrrC family)
MPKLRTVSRWTVVTLVAVVGASIALHSLVFPTEAAPRLVGGTALGAQPAPVFHLRDQTGTLISLDRLRGRPVVLTFLDAACPPAACSSTVQSLDRTASLLGTQASEIAWLAVSTNPQTTPSDVVAFLAGNHVAVDLHVLLGTQQQLTLLLAAYHVQGTTSPAQAAGDVARPLSTYLIDGQGREREMLDQTYDARLAAQDLRALLAA